MPVPMVLPMTSPRELSVMRGGPANAWLATKLAVKPISAGVVLFCGTTPGWLLRA